MRKSIGQVVVAFSISLSLVAAAGISQAGDANTNSEGLLQALDANRGTGVQVNADNWENMDNVLAGNGSQAQDTLGSSNTGSGSQDNSSSSADGWDGVSGSANNGSGAQLGTSSNSNGGDRISNDILVDGGSDTAVASAALAASVTGNSVAISELNATIDSSMTFDQASGFRDMAGVSAVAMAAGSNASQNVSVQVTADVSGSNIH
jgi:hypothetical protein